MKNKTKQKRFEALFVKTVRECHKEWIRKGWVKVPGTVTQVAEYSALNGEVGISSIPRPTKKIRRELNP